MAVQALEPGQSVSYGSHYIALKARHINVVAGSNADGYTSTC